MINKIANTIASALEGLQDGSTVLIGGFGTAGIPNELIEGLIEQGAKDLIIVNNNAGSGDIGMAALLKTGRVRKVICSFPRQADSYVFDHIYRTKKIELELVPKAIWLNELELQERVLGGGVTPTAYGTELAKNPDGSAKESKVARHDFC